MSQLFTNTTLVLPDRLLPHAWLLEQDGKIARYGVGAPPAADERIDCGGCYLSPGFIDVHCHGGGGGSFDDLDPASHVRAMKLHLSHGVTSLTPTPSAFDPETVGRLADIKKEIDQREDVPHHLGYFIEALAFAQPHPDLSVGCRKPPVIRPEDYLPSIRAAHGCINRLMAAPELEGGMALGRALRAEGITACAGHSNATYAEMLEACANGYSCVTHLYSCMSTVTRDRGFRRGGLVEAALLLDDLDVEIICDGCHLPAELIQLAIKCKGYDRLLLVSDCGPLGGAENGQTFTMPFGGSSLEVVIEDGVCKPAARNCFAGSVASSDRLVRTVYKEAQVPLWAAVRMATKTPARHCGCAGVKGEISIGCDADLVCFDEEIQVKAVWLMGRRAAL